MEDERTSCMRIVNISLQNLSAATQSWVETVKSALKTQETQGDHSRCFGCRLGVLQHYFISKLITLELVRSGPNSVCSTDRFAEEVIWFLDVVYPRLLRIGAATSQSGGSILSLGLFRDLCRSGPRIYEARSIQTRDRFVQQVNQCAPVSQGARRSTYAVFSGAGRGARTRE
jgi:hypothetical protein